MKEIERTVAIPFSGGQLTSTLILRTDSDDAGIESILDDMQGHVVDSMNGYIIRLMAGLAKTFGEDGETDITRNFTIDCGGPASLQLVLNCKLDKQVDADVAMTKIAVTIVPPVYMLFTALVLDHECSEAVNATDYNERAVEVFISRLADSFGVDMTDQDRDFFGLRRDSPVM